MTQHTFKHTLLSLAILASCSAHAHAEYTEVNSDSVVNNNKEQVQTKKNKEVQS